MRIRTKWALGLMALLLVFSGLIGCQSPETGGSGTSPAVAIDSETAGCREFVPQEDPKISMLVRRIQTKLSSDSSEPEIPSGAGVAIVYKGRLFSAEGVGSRAKDGYLDGTQPADRDTLFWVASTSKFMTAAGAMTLLDDGLLDLTAPVTEYLPDYSEKNGREDQIMVDNLLKMISGLKNDSGCTIFSVSASHQPDGCASAAVPDADHVLKNMFSPEKLGGPPFGNFNSTEHGAPGQATWTYANWGIMLAGRVMEVAGGQFFPELMKDRVFEPAGMCTATYTPEDVFAHGNFAVGSGAAAVDGHCPEPELKHDSHGPWFPDELACPGRNPNGGVRASAVDLGRFAEALIRDLAGDGILMSSDAARQMFEPRTGRARIEGQQTRWGDTYGYCNFHHIYKGYDVYTHGGGRPGFGTLFWVLPDQEFGVAIANNVGNTNYFEDEMEFAVRCYLDGDCQ